MFRIDFFNIPFFYKEEQYCFLNKFLPNQTKSVLMFPNYYSNIHEITCQNNYCEAFSFYSHIYNPFQDFEFNLSIPYLN